MSDAQFGVLIAALTAGLGGIAAVIRWSVGILTGALSANTKAMVENSASNARLSTKIDKVTAWVEDNTPTERPRPPRAKTNPQIALVVEKDKE